MASYYQRINGKNYDKKMIESAKQKSGVDGKKKISLKDAKLLLGTIKDGGKITDIERRTLSYILENYNFSESALKWIEKIISEELSQSSATKKPQTNKELEEKKSETKHQEDLDETLEENIEDNIYKDEEKTYMVADDEGKTKISKETSRIIFFIVTLILFFAIAFFLRKNMPEEHIKESVKINDKNNNEIKEKKPVKEIKITEKKPAIKESKNESDNKKIYIVKENDTLMSISHKLYGNYSHWEKIYKINKETLSDPSVIFPGQKIFVP